MLVARIANPFYKVAPETPNSGRYKRGRRRRWDNDDVQLCARPLPRGDARRAVPGRGDLYIKSRRRREIVFTAALRARPKTPPGVCNELVASGVRAPVLKPRCRGCSLHDLCMPELLARRAGHGLSACAVCAPYVEKVGRIGNPSTDVRGARTDCHPSSGWTSAMR